MPNNITISIGNGRVKVDYKKFTFPAGETGIELDFSKIKTMIGGNSNSLFTIKAEISEIDGLFDLLMITDAIRNSFRNVEIDLEIPYIPFGRQDRCTSEGTSFTLKIIADMINSCGFRRVETYTPHSNVSELLIKNIVVREPFYQFWMEFCKHDGMSSDVVILAPDAGAEKRAYTMAKNNHIDEVYVCTKHRNPKTGEIVKVNVPEIPDGKHIIVVDDIVDGGGTFIALAKALPKNYNTLSLFVTHGIFSKGKQVLHDAGFNNVVSVYDFIYKQRGYDSLDSLDRAKALDELVSEAQELNMGY